MDIRVLFEEKGVKGGSVILFTGGGFCIHGVRVGQTPFPRPEHYRLRGTVNKRVVRILLEWILVTKKCKGCILDELIYRRSK